MPDACSLSEIDEHLWLAQQVEALSNHRVNAIDYQRLAQYLQVIIARDEQEFASRLTILLREMLCLTVLPERWSLLTALSIREQQSELHELLDVFPRLEQQCAKIFAGAYHAAVAAAVEESCLPADRFPPTPAWTFEEALAFAPWPDEAHEASAAVQAADVAA